jgi:polysaccharide deacetylase family protein (PEP-CTERM system associated)
MVENIFSIDVEEIFHTEYARYLRNYSFKWRTPKIIPIILDLLRKKDIVATFFITGELAEKFPEIISMIRNEKHEVAFHGWFHLPLWNMNIKLFREELARFKKIYPNCIGYRAPSFSLNENTQWMLKELQEAGFSYDSSLFPTWTPLYGIYSAPVKPYKPSLGNFLMEGNMSYDIFEFPLAVYNLLGIKLPIAGGFWLRFWNIRLIKKGIKKLNKMGIPAVIFIHSWEFDPETPRFKLGFFKSFATYYNLNKVSKKLYALVDMMSFTNFVNFLEEHNRI